MTQRIDFFSQIFSKSLVVTLTSDRLLVFSFVVEGVVFCVEFEGEAFHADSGEETVSVGKFDDWVKDLFVRGDFSVDEDFFYLFFALQTAYGNSVTCFSSAN